MSEQALRTLSTVVRHSVSEGSKKRRTRQEPHQKTGPRIRCKRSRRSHLVVDVGVDGVEHPAEGERRTAQPQRDARADGGAPLPRHRSRLLLRQKAQPNRMGKILYVVDLTFKKLLVS